MNKTFTVWGLLLLGCVALICWQHGTIAKLREEAAALEDQVKQFSSLRDEHQRLLTSQPDPEELQRLRSEHSELLKLRGEFTRLKRELRTLQTAQAEKPEATRRSGALSLNDIISVTNAVTVQLRNNETLITGGWELSPGRKTFAFVTPQFTDANGNVVETAAAKSQITLRT